MEAWNKKRKNGEFNIDEMSAMDGMIDDNGCVHTAAWHSMASWIGYGMERWRLLLIVLFCSCNGISRAVVASLERKGKEGDEMR